MQMDPGLVEELAVCLIIGQIGTDITVGNLGRFLHHLAKLAGQLEAAIEGMNARGFNGQGGAAHGGPGQTGNNANTTQRLFLAERWRAEQGGQIIRSYADFFYLFFQHAHDGLAHQLGQLLVQAAYTGFPGIALDQLAQGLVTDAQLAFAQPGALQLTRPQVVFGDGQLLFTDITGQADNIHSIQQGAGNTVEGVGGTDEKYLGQVQAQVQIMVKELAVLLRIQCFQQG